MTRDSPMTSTVRADHLIDQRAAIVAELAPLFARYGEGGTADYERVIIRARCQKIARDTLTAAGVKITESAVEAEAYTHPAYSEAVVEMTNGRHRCFELEQELATLDMRIRQQERER